MTQSIQREPAFLRRKQVETRTGLSRFRIYCDFNNPLSPPSPRWCGARGYFGDIKDGVFPKPVPLGPRAVGWLESGDFSLRQRLDRGSGEDCPGRWPAGGVTTRMHGPGTILRNLALLNVLWDGGEMAINPALLDDRE